MLTSPQAPPTAHTPVPAYASVPASSPVAAYAPTQVIVARRPRRVTAFEVAFLLGALVAVGGMSFAVGRWSADQGAGTGRSVIAAVSGQPVVGRPSTAIGPTAAGVSVNDGASSVGDTAPAATPSPGGTTRSTPASAGGAAGQPAMGGIGAAGLGFGPGGLQGTLEAIDADRLVLTTSDGSQQSVTIDEETRFVSEADIDPSTLEAGDEVRVQPRFGSFPGAGEGQAAGDTMVASQVTLLATMTP